MLRWRHALTGALAEHPAYRDRVGGVMAGRLALITGGNTGLGKETAVALATMGARVVFTTRDENRGVDALREIRARSGSDTVESMELDLARFASVRDFVASFADAHDRLHVLVNNAGVVLRRRHETEDGC